MKKYYCLIILFTLLFCTAKATHNRAGEITYKQISGYTFEFTVTTFTYTLSAVELNGGRVSLEVEWGDNTTSEAPRISRLDLPDYYRKNTYVIRHTFPGPGLYKIVMQDPNRNLGVLNIPNSVNVIFSVETTMLINPQWGANNTPVLLNDPIDKAAVGRVFIHNPAAFDYDGDSLSYKLTVCTKDNGAPIENYTFPKSSHTPIYVNPVTGDLIWDAPVDTGIYNIAMNIEEWRKGNKIGIIERDMQVEVHKADNNPPRNLGLKKLCVEAGKFISLNITSTDTIIESVKQYATGGPFVVANNKALFEVIQTGPGFSTSKFSWQTDCSHVRKQPYVVVIKSEDNNKIVKLVAINNFDIYILGPAPKNLTALPRNNAISISWSKSICPNATGYDIYRSTSPATFQLDSCVGGIPAGSGYVKIATVNSINDTTFLDNNNGQSLSRGIDYCYRVVAIFPDGANSYPSNESCATIVPGSPALTSASVTKIDSTQGEIFVSWIKPNKKLLDSLQALGPYEYLIYRTDNLAGSNFALINTRPSADLADTTFTDTNLNTLRFPYNYKVELYNNTTGNRFLIGNAETASSMYPDLFPSDNQITIKFAKNVPWLNNKYIIYRQNSQTLAFDSIASTLTEEYVDKGLANGHKYTYRVKAYGSRQINNATYKTLNWSHINSTSPLDTIKPCSPDLHLKSICDSSLIILKWPNIDSCSNDVVKYNVYFKNKPTDSFSSTPIATINNTPGVDTFVFRHTPPLTPKNNPAGCYAVTAVDSFANESLIKEDCINNCSPYSLPNVFSPNNDNRNDVYIANNPDGYVKQVDMKIFTRWGKLVFHTTDPYINWDGRDQETKQFVSTGVYFYVCDVYEPTITGIYLHNLRNLIYVYYNTSGNPTQP
jgi:gliding motility-associated-like protein